MKRVKVLVEFKDKETGVLHKPDDEIVISDERLAAIRTVHENLVQVMGEVEPEPVEEVEPIEEVEATDQEVAPVQPKRGKK